MVQYLCQEIIAHGESFVALSVKGTNLLIVWFTVTFFSGFLLANPVLICASFIPLFVYLMALLTAPSETQIKKIGLPSSARNDELVHVKIEGKIGGGLGAVVIHDEIPKPFQLIEGTNYKIISKEFKNKEFSFSYKMRCTKCGIYVLQTGWETRHILGLHQSQFSTTQEIQQLRVFPVLPKIRRVRLPTPKSKRIQPSGSVADIGPLSTDFKEIRSYFYGDPFKIINWKASARAAGRGGDFPLVNEYEREGKLAIWLFLDSSPGLAIGTSIDNALEYCIRGAYVLSYSFLSKGYSLGMYIYNHRGETFHADLGKKQFIRIAEELLKLCSPKAGLELFWDEGLLKAVERNRKYLLSQCPRVVVITHLTLENWSDILAGTKRILAYRRRREQPSVILINVLPYRFISASSDEAMFAARVFEETSRSLSSRLRDSGLIVLDWEPRNESMENLLLNTLRIR